MKDLNFTGQKKGGSVSVVIHMDLMIVAHIDDETFFGAHELTYSQNLHLICLNGKSEEGRAELLTQAMSIFPNVKKIKAFACEEIKGNKKPYLLYEECESVRNLIKDEVKNLDYKRVITHGPDGEYGHPEHQLTHRLVLEIFDHEKIYIFGDPNKIPQASKNNDPKVRRLRDEALNFYISSPSEKTNRWLCNIAKQHDYGPAVKLKECI